MDKLNSKSLIKEKKKRIVKRIHPRNLEYSYRSSQTHGSYIIINDSFNTIYSKRVIKKEFNCDACGEKGKYRLPKTLKVYCKVNCYKQLVNK